MVFYSEDNYKISSYLQGGESSLECLSICWVSTPIVGISQKFMHRVSNYFTWLFNYLFKENNIKI
jgi:hypothetical protein